jgi:hypothetical protein
MYGHARNNPNPRINQDDISTPPSTGSSVHSKVGSITIGVSVDTSDVDRIAIGMRLYNMFKADNAMNKLHHNGDMVYMHEGDINAMYQLVNNTERCIRVYR